MQASYGNMADRVVMNPELSQISTAGVVEVFKSDNPDNIDKLTNSELLNYVVKGNYGAKPAARLKVFNMIYDVLGYDKENEVMLMSASQPQCKLCVAAAGSGKTTAANIQIVGEKIMRKSRLVEGSPISGGNILVLVYNKHNVGDFKKRHKEMVSTLRAANIKGLDIDDTVNVTTVHSFAGRILDMFPHLQSGIKKGVIKEYKARDLLARAVNMAHKKAVKEGRMKSVKGDFSNNVNISSLYTFYGIYKESLKSVHQLNSNDQFLQLELDEDFVEDTFSFYEKLKNAGRHIDFSDLLTDCYNLLRKHPEACQKLRRYYEYVVADEVQDLSPLMFEILSLFVGDEIPLMCIGDEDQSIYGFRGADMYNIINFKEKFSDARVYTLSRNRRCRKEIFDYAKFVIQKNVLRFNKPLGYVKDGGSVEFIPYSSPNGQLSNLITRIRSMSEEERDNAVICTRANEGNAILVQFLADLHIPHYVVGGLGMNAFNAYSHELYKHVTDVLNVLYMPMDAYSQLNLYKVMPLKKADLYDVIGYDPDKKMIKHTDITRHFADLDYGKLSTLFEFKGVLKQLSEISSRMSTSPMNSYITEVMSLMFKYFWRTRRYFKSNDTVDDAFERLVFRFFNSDMTYKDFISKYSEDKSFCKTNQAISKGIAVSTFHRLKGLEFDTVFLTNMDNDIFPDFHSIESRRCSDRAKLELKESETRLAYVAITRARNKLFVYYNEDNPSIYVRSYIGAKDKINVYDAVNSSTFDNVSDFDGYGGIDLEDPELNSNDAPIENPPDAVLHDPFGTVSDDSLMEENSLMEGDSLMKGGSLMKENSLIESDSLTDDNSLIEGDSLAEAVSLMEGDSLTEDNSLIEDSSLIEADSLTEAGSLIEDSSLTEGDSLMEDDYLTEAPLINSQPGYVSILGNPLLNKPSAETPLDDGLLIDDSLDDSYADYQTEESSSVLTQSDIKTTPVKEVDMKNLNLQNFEDLEKTVSRKKLEGANSNSGNKMIFNKGSKLSNFLARL